MRHNVAVGIALMLLLPGAVLAQSLDGSLGSTDSFTISASPQYPLPYSQVTLSFLSPSLDLTNATLTVTVGDNQFYRGTVRPVAVSVGRAGSVTVIGATITSGGTDYTKSLVIQPQDVSLIAEPIAWVPALYPGKPLIPLEGDTRIVAIANMRDAAGKTIDPATLSYSWTVENTQIADYSGIGKQSIIVASPLQYRERQVSVSIQSQAGNLVGGASLTLNPAEPIVRVYENDPLLGVRFDRALSNSYAIQGAEAGLYAAPFSFPTTNGAPILQWFLNNAVAQTGNSITLRPAGSGQGNASLSVTASAVGTSNTATTDLSLSFGAAKTSNFFGL